MLKSSEGMLTFSAREVQMWCGLILGQPISLSVKLCMGAFAGKNCLSLNNIVMHQIIRSMWRPGRMPSRLS